MNANLSGTSQLFQWFTYQFAGGKHLLALINQSYFQPHVLLDDEIANKLKSRKITTKAFLRQLESSSQALRTVTMVTHDSALYQFRID